MSGSRNFLQKNKRVFLPEIVHQDVLKQANNCALKDEFILEDEFVLFSYIPHDYHILHIDDYVFPDLLLNLYSNFTIKLVNSSTVMRKKRESQKGCGRHCAGRESNNQQPWLYYLF